MVRHFKFQGYLPPTFIVSSQRSYSKTSSGNAMPATILQLQKRVLGDATKAHSNANLLPSPNSAKRRKLDIASGSTNRQRGINGLVKTHGSSQPKSQFEEEVLEKLTQNMSDLKRSNAEKDQQWERPPLTDFDGTKDSLCFQQIEAERGNLHGGRPTIKLFGVTEASSGP